MTRAILGVVLLISLAGCTGDGTDAAPAPTTVQPAPTTAEPAASPTPATSATKPPTDDVAACYDGRCELEVRRSVEIPLDPAFRLPGLTVTVARGGVVAASAGVQTGGSVGSQLTLNDTLRIEILSARGTTARVLLSPA